VFPGGGKQLQLQRIICGVVGTGLRCANSGWFGCEAQAINQHLLSPQRLLDMQFQSAGLSPLKSFSWRFVVGTCYTRSIELKLPSLWTIRY